MKTANAATPSLSATALGLGIAADGLLRAPVWGLNVVLLVASLAGWGIHADLRADRATPGSWWPWVGACGFGAMWALRDEPTLLAFDLLAALCLLTLPLLPARGIALCTAGALDLLVAPLRAARQAVVGGAQVLFRDLSWSSGFSRRHRFVHGTVLGLLAAVPILIVFGALFASADPTLRVAAYALFEWDLGPTAGHIAGVGAGTWLAAGYLRGLLVGEQRAADAGRVPGLGLHPAGTALGALVLVFTVFVAVQAGNLFRGDAWIRDTTGLTFAEYARGGFFQLVAASALALPVVYGATWAAGAVDAAALRSLRALQGVALALVAAVALSALWRMGLYVEAYGLTEDRLYGAAIIVWIAAMVGVFARTVLAGRLEGAARGAVVAAALVLALLNAVSPDALIARINIGRGPDRTVDAVHLARLSADAVPTIAGRLARLDPATRCRLATALVARSRAEVRGDWRGWNVARRQARGAMPTLEREAASCVLPPEAAPDGSRSPQ